MPTPAAQLVLTQRHGRALKVTPAAPPSGSFAPSGALWDAALAVYTATGGTGNIWRADSGAMRQSSNLGDGVAIGQDVGFVHDWLSPGTLARALTQEGAQRGVFSTIDGVDCIFLDGDQTIDANKHMISPMIDPIEWTAVLVTRLTDAVDARQTLWEHASMRFDAQFDGAAPSVRVGGGVRYEFGFGSLLDRWTCLVVQGSKQDGSLQLYYDGSPDWVIAPISQWAENSASLLNRNSYATNPPSSPFGAPATAGYKTALWIDKKLTEPADIQALVNLAVDGTAITITIPVVTAPPPPPPDEVMPTPLSFSPVIAAGDTAGLANAIANAPAGRRILLANGNHTLPNTINNSNGTAANPIVLSSQNKLGAILNGGQNMNADHFWFWGVQFKGRWYFTGQNPRVLRCRGIAGSGSDWITNQSAKDMVIAYCDWPDMSNNRFSVEIQPRNGARNCQVLNCLIKGWAGGAVPMRTGATIADTNLGLAPQIFKRLLFDGDNKVQNSSSEFAFEIKGSGNEVDGLTVKNVGPNSKGTVAIRHGVGNKLSNVITKSGRGILSFHGIFNTPNEWYNCRCEGGTFFRVMAGMQEGSLPLDTSGAANYQSSQNVLLSDCSGLAYIGWMYNVTGYYPPPHDALDTRLRRHAGTVELQFQQRTTQTGTSPYPVPTAPASEVIESEVGPFAGTAWEY